MATPVYEDVLEEVKQLAPEEQQKLAKEVLGQFKTKKTKKPSADGEERPKRVISEEQKAKMKAGREAYLERKRAAAASDDSDAAEEKPKKPRAKKAAAAAEGEEKKPSNRKPMTEEHKAAMKAGRERKKAEKAAGGAPAPAEEKPAPPVAPPAAAPEEDEEEVPVHLVDWENDFGEGAKTYKRLDYEGRTYVYELETKKYLGAYVKKSNTLKPSIPDPLVPEDD
jgi:hypothetical protein